MKRVLLCSLVSLITLSVHATDKTSGDVDPVRLMQGVEEQSCPDDEEVRIDMELIENGGKVSKRNAVYWQKLREAGSRESMKLIRFSSPAEMSGSAVLTVENKDRSDDQWLYLPAYHTSRKVPSSNRSDRYMGTDFFFEDVSNDKIKQYQYTVLKRETLGGRDYLVVQQTPVNAEVNAESAYSKKIQWVDPERLQVARIDYYNKKDGLSKRMEAREPLQVNGKWRWQEVAMVDLKLNHKTVIRYSDRKINQGLDASRFTVRSLERDK